MHFAFSVLLYVICVLLLFIVYFYFSVALSVSSITKDGCTLAWSPCKPTGTDTIAYLLQINENDTDYKQVCLVI